MTTNQTIDVTRLNRAERRKLSTTFKGKILGRNLPYQKNLHGTLDNFYQKRQQEITQDNNG